MSSISQSRARAPASPAQPSPAWSELPEFLRSRLAAEGVLTLEDWRALGRKRHRIFGVTRPMVARLDAIAGEKA